METSKTIISIITILIAGFVGLFVTLVFVFLYPIEVINLKYPIEIINHDKTVKAGENIYFSIKYDKYKPFPETVYREVIISRDGKSEYILAASSIEAILPMGKDKQIIMTVDSPIFITNARGVVKVVFKYTVYGRTIITGPVESEKFNILEGKEIN